MKKAINAGLGFGITSGVTTTLGMVVGLLSSGATKPAILSAIFIIAFSDALSDAFGVHVSQESQEGSQKDPWKAALVTFFAKLIVALTFTIPIFLFSFSGQIYASILWGIFLTITYSFYLGKKNKENVLAVVSEHLLVSVCVIFVSYFIGAFVYRFIN